MAVTRPNDDEISLASGSKRRKFSPPDLPPPDQADADSNASDTSKESGMSDRYIGNATHSTARYEWTFKGGKSVQVGRWKTRKASEGFYATSDLLARELKRVTESGNWDAYFLEPNVQAMKCISLSDCQLEKVPSSLCQITCLTRLYFTNNKLTTLPSELSQLENLMNINLSWNKFVRIPDALCLLPNLRILSLQHNQLNNKGLDKIKRLSHLEELYLSSNDLKAKLPLSICRLTSLRLLDASNNRMTTLPNEMSNLAELRVLKLRQNDIKSLPKSIGNLKHLRIACFAENSIQSVDFESFLKQTDLKDLCLFSNRIDNKEELEKYIEKFRINGKVLRATENRVEISQTITCDSPYDFCRQDATFVHDGTEEVKDWVEEAKAYLAKEDISSTIKTPTDKAVDILRSVRSSHVVIPVFTIRFQELLDENEEAGSTLRDALSEVIKANRVHNYLVVLREECFYSSNWSNATFITIRPSQDSDTEDEQHGFDELCEKIRSMKGERMNLSSVPALHF